MSYQDANEWRESDRLAHDEPGTIDRDEQPRFGFVAVYRTRDEASVAADDAREAGGRRVRVGSHEDVVASLQGEMREEEEQSTVGPGVAAFTHEASRSLIANVALWGFAGAALLVWLGFVPVAGMAFGVRLAIAAGIGLAAGATFGLVAGAGMGAYGPARKFAAEEGVTVRVDAPHASLERILRMLQRSHPMRIDRFEFSAPAGPMPTEEPADERGTRPSRLRYPHPSGPVDASAMPGDSRWGIETQAGPAEPQRKRGERRGA